jgi:DNA-binding IclR family transcriptional regulator
MITPGKPSSSRHRRNSARDPGVRSVETAAAVLVALARGGTALSLTEIAGACAMPTAKTYRYLVSLCRARLAVQDPHTARYDLGPIAHEIGRNALRGASDAPDIDQRLHALRDATQETVCLWHWTARGPTLMHVEQHAHAVSVRARVGVALPLLTTAVGHIYAAFGNAPGIRARIQAELRRSGKTGTPLKRIEVERLIEDVRARGLARIRGADRLGVNAVAAPIFDRERHLWGAVSIIGDDHLNTTWNSRNAALIRKFTSSVLLTR